jgi:hypothetical protein
LVGTSGCNSCDTWFKCWLGTTILTDVFYDRTQDTAASFIHHSQLSYCILLFNITSSVDTFLKYLCICFFLIFILYFHIPPNDWIFPLYFHTSNGLTFSK